MPIKKEVLAQLLQQAEKAHAEYEKHIGQRDPNWPQWYADYIISQLHARDDTKMSS